MVYSSNTCYSSTACHSSSPSGFAAAQSDDSGVWNAMGSALSSPGPHSAKRALPEEDNTASKRLRLEASTLSSHTASASSSSAPIHPPRSSVQPRATVGISSRVDRAATTQSLVDFSNLVREPILAALDRVRGKCISCLLIGRQDWENHHYDACQWDDMHYGRDGVFVSFKRTLRLQDRFCYACCLNSASHACNLPDYYLLILFLQNEFPHAPKTFGFACPNIGIVIRVLFAFSWGDYPLFQDFPGRPTEITAYSANAVIFQNLLTWFHSPAAGRAYHKNTYYNIYHVFIFAMRNANIIE